MNTPDCEYSASVISATKSTQWPEDVRTHAAACSRCRETIAMTTMMNEISAREPTHSLPNYRTIWLKARYARKQERLTKFDILSLAGLSLFGIATLAVLLMVVFPQVFRGIFDIPTISVPQLTAAFSRGTSVFILAGVALIVWLLTKDWKYAG